MHVRLRMPRAPWIHRTSTQGDGQWLWFAYTVDADKQQPSNLAARAGHNPDWRYEFCCEPGGNFMFNSVSPHETQKKQDANLLPHTGVIGAFDPRGQMPIDGVADRPKTQANGNQNLSPPIWPRATPKGDDFYSRSQYRDRRAPADDHHRYQTL